MLVCVRRYLSLYQACLWSSAKSGKIGDEREKGSGLIRMKGRRILLCCPLSLLLSAVLSREKKKKSESSEGVCCENMCAVELSVVFAAGVCLLGRACVRVCE